MQTCARNRGFTLLEVMIGVFLSSVLMTGIVQLMSGSVGAYRLQLSQSQLEESSRFAREILMSHITQAGYQPEPWNQEQYLPSLTHEALNDISLRGDQLGLQRLSQVNCYGNQNPVTDSDGKPEFHLLQTRIHVNDRANLAMTCRYGPDASSLVIQMNNFGLVENVEIIQVLYAEDQNDDAIADRWVTAQTWGQESNILAIKIALLFSSLQAFDQQRSTTITLLDKTITPPADGHLRRVSSLTAAIRGRLK
jgi:prepilin-type N-terminal cleavage/methylation domain-containing protein